ncbi:MAG: hypothetical protein ABL885_02585 [Methylophilaceae bacterium]
MSQQINLINPSLIQQKDLLTAVTIGLAYLVLILIMLAWYAASASQIKGLVTTADQAGSALQQIQSRLTEATAARAPRTANQALQLELAQLEAKHKVQTQILQLISHSNTSSDKGLAGVMRGFARQTLEGLWLTGFNMDNARHAMTIFGRSLQADLLPRYIAKLGQEAVFSGQAFGGLHFQQPVVAEAKATPVPVNNASPALPAEPAVSHALPDFVEFELQALEVQDAVSPVSSAKPAEHKS